MLVTPVPLIVTGSLDVSVPFSSSVAPLATDVPAAVVPSELSLEICSAPTFTLVEPWYELPDGKIIRPGPIFTTPPGPETEDVALPMVSTSGEGNWLAAMKNALVLL